jgi:hypothetical protein
MRNWFLPCKKSAACILYRYPIEQHPVIAGRKALQPFSMETDWRKSRRDATKWRIPVRKDGLFHRF